MKAPTSWRMFADTVTVGGWTSAVKLIGLVKVVLAARLFGAGDAMDAYLIAFLLPSFFIDMLAGPLDSGLIPTLIGLRESRGKAEAGALYSGVLAVTGGCLTIAAILTSAISGWLLPMLASSFTPTKLGFTQRLLFIMIAIIPLSGLAATWRAVLNSDHRFAYAAAVPAITPVVSIVAMLAGARSYGVMSLAAGTLVGAGLEALATGIGVKLAGYGMIPRWTGMTVALRQVANQYAPLVAVTLVMTGSALIDQGMAARLGSGSVAALSYGTRLLAVLITIGPTAVGTAVLPHLSSGATLTALRKYGVVVLALILPATAVLFLISEPIVRALFQNGAFGEASTHLVAAVQSASLLQLPVAVLLALEVRLTSAMRANSVLYHVAALSLILTFVFDWLFMRWWGVVGIALAGAAIRLVSALYLSCKIYGMRARIAGFRMSDSLP
jgi:putative peptidoglycan lipid II flippase